MGIVKTWLADLEVVDGEIGVAHSVSPDERVDRVLKGGLSVRRDLVYLAVEAGLVEDFEDYREKLHDVMMRVARRRLEEAATVEAMVMQAVESLDDLDRASNLLSERLVEWAGLVRPEEKRHGEELARGLEGESSALGRLARSLLGLYETRGDVEEYVAEQMQGLAPNLSALAGPVLAARLMSLAGGLEKLARMPGSRIQVIGAEQALFKHLRGRAPSPKHGIIFQHPLIRKAPWWQRGKIARAFASKLAIAARIDHYSGEFNPELEEDLRGRIDHIRETYPNPPEEEK